ncbi:MAG: septum formation protein Maf [Elusimicrobia bacterium]|nr:septum formation protein Maf [Elusimicrobiota bacterium]
MKKSGKTVLYLASASKARVRILSDLGLIFKSLPVAIPEHGVNGGKVKSFPALVKRNARLKALAAAEKIPEGVVIAADTVSGHNGVIYGKPRCRAEAVSMLKKLSGSAQRVYTGIAVARKDLRGRLNIKTASERTTVYMDRLSAEEIRSYVSAGSALGKAGSFDIQGRGAFFIRKIDGCFYNVVGLPARLLYRMLKEMKISLLVLLPFILLCAGCVTEYNASTGKMESYYYSTEREVRAGEAVARAVEREYKLAGDPLLQEKAGRIGSRIASVCGRKEIKYTFKVLDDEEINAVSLPGGFVYVNKGVLEKASGDDEVAGVLAHEVGHIVCRHSIKKMQGMTGYTLLRILLAQAPDPGKVGTAADAAFTELMLGYSREDELQADALAARYMKEAGYDPRAMISFLERLWRDEKRRPPRRMSYYKTHPYIPDRIRVVKRELDEKMDFTDYINIEQLPAGQDATH